ncbi:MAG: FG-GAP-like repeat-containing protein [Bacteroidota bacterium]
MKNTIRQGVLLGFLWLSLSLSGLAQINFNEVSNNVGISTEYLNLLAIGGGAAFFDYDNDGWEDVWITRGLQPDKLYRNNGDGTFSDVSSIIIQFAGANTMGVATADLNNDGYREVLLTTFIGFPNVLLKNNGDGTFTDISESSGLSAYDAWSMAASFGDVNMDGLLDLYIGNYILNPVTLTDSLGNITGFAHDCSPNWLFVNEGLDADDSPSFSLMDDSTTVSNAGCTLANTFSDFNSDKDPDLLVVNDFGEWIIPNVLLDNNAPQPGFTDISLQSDMGTPMNGMGVAIGDYDQDGDLDYYMTDIGINDLFENQSNNTFIEKAAETGVEDTFVDSLLTVGWGTFFADLDNDTDLDLFVTNGYTPTSDLLPGNPSNPNRLYINQLAESQQAIFTDASVESGINDPQKGRGCAYADFDKDGDLDYIVVNVNAGTGAIEPVLFYENSLDNDNNWLQVKLVGQSTNRDAFGTQMRIVVGDKSWQYEIDGGSSHASQNSSVAHFGLGTTNQVDSLYIYWPRSETQILTELEINKRITITEGGLMTSVANSLEENTFQLTATPNPFNSNSLISYDLPKADRVRLSIHTANGRLVEEHQFTQAEGSHQFNWSNPKLAEGLYFIRLQTSEGFEQSLRVLKK